MKQWIVNLFRHRKHTAAKRAALQQLPTNVHYLENSACTVAAGKYVSMYFNAHLMLLVKVAGLGLTMHSKPSRVDGEAVLLRCI